MRPRWALALVVVLVLAGCSGFSTGDGAPDREPYGVDDELEPGLEDPENGSRDPDHERLAPGLTTAGVDNAALLVDGHYEALEAAAGNRTYVVGLRESRRAENGSEVQQIEGRAVVEAPNRWYRTTNITEPGDSGPTISEGWAENGLQIFRLERPNGAVEYNAISASPQEPPLERRLRSILSAAVDATVEAETVDGTNWYRVTANVSDVDGVRNASFVVRDDGLLRRVSYTRTAEIFPNTSVAETTYQFDAPGPASLERPDWFEEGLEETDAELPGNESDDGGTSDEEPSDHGADDEWASDGEEDDGSAAEPGGEGADDEQPDEDAADAESSDEAQAVGAGGSLLE